MPERRQILTLLCAATIAAGAGALLLAQQNVRLSGLDPGLPVSVAGSSTSGTTSAMGDLELALDPNKNYNVYRRECSRYEVIEQGTDEDRRCQAEQQQNPPAGSESCGRCVRVGAILLGNYSAASQASGGARSNLRRNVIIGAAAAGGAIGVAAALGGDDASSSGSSLSLTSFQGRSYQGAISKTSDGCGGTFAPQSMILVRFVNVDASGTATIEVVHTNANTTFRGTGRLTKNGDGSFSFVADPAVNGTLSSTASGTVSADGMRVTGFTNTITRSSGCTGPVVYGAGAGILPAL